MDRVESARKILEAFKEGAKFLCLKELAIASGFPSVANRDFKEGFNFLISKNVIKLQQSGWSSEKRGKRNAHPKTVILNANIYEMIEPSFDLESTENLTELLTSISKEKGNHQYLFGSRPLPDSVKEKYKACEDCKRTPAVFITAQAIPVCAKHWSKLANSNAEW